MREWMDNLNITDSGTNAVHDINRWTCQCIKFKHSTFFICNHLIKASNLKPKYYSDIVVRDYPLFVEAAQETIGRDIPLDNETADQNNSKYVS